MYMIKKLSSEFIDEETGIRAVVSEEGKVSFFNNRNFQYRGNHPNAFVFINSNKETVFKVLNALGSLADKIPTPKKKKK